MAITPNSTIYLLNVPLEIREVNQVRFSSVGTQTSYFLGTVVNEATGYSYVRKPENSQGYIKYDGHIDTLFNCNYVMYQNTNYTNKWFYAYITDLVHISDRRTDIYIETDAWQTWQFNVTQKICRVEREHTQQYSSGLPVRNTLPEPYDYGDSYDVVAVQNVDNERGNFLIASSIDLILDAGEENPIINSASGGNYQNVNSALSYYLLGTNIGSSSINNFLGAVKNKPWVGQGIHSITYIPKRIVDGTNYTIQTSEIGTVPLQLAVVNDFVNIDTATLHFNLYDNFPNFTNSKLNFFPYSYIEVTDYNGQILMLKPENFQLNGGGLVNDIELYIRCHLYVEPKISYSFYNYNRNGGGEGLNVSMIDQNFAQVPVQLNQGLLQYANNSNNFNFSEITTLLTGSLGVATSLYAGNVTGAIGAGVGTFTSLASTEVQRQNTDLLPPSISGQNNNDPFKIANSLYGIQIKWKTIKQEYITRMENNFTRYGYSVNTNKVPNLTQYNQYYNYIKTNGSDVQGAIPQDDLRKINNMFDRGVTMYSSPYNIGNV